MTPTAKAEALKAIDTVRKNLRNGGPADDLTRRLMAETLDYASEQVVMIQELKRARRTPKVPV